MVAGTATGPATRYQTEAVRRGDLTVTVTATGTVQPTTEVEVSSAQSGTLKTVEVDYNDEVEVGQVLARLDDTKFRAQVANAEAALAGAKADVAQAEATAHEASEIYESKKELDRRGVITQTDFVTFTANNERAKAALEAAQASLTLAQANLELANADLEDTVIRSPIKGVVLDRAYSAGQIVAASLSAPTLFTLAEDLTRMELLVDIDEADIGQVAVGNRATFTVDAYSGESFPAVISQVRYAPEETDDVVTYKAVLQVDNGRKLLRPGMTATATITVATETDVLQVPNAALRYAPPQIAEGSGSGTGGLIGMIMPKPPGQVGVSVGSATAKSVWVLRDGQSVEVAVTVGASDGKYTIISSADLEEGAQVITDQSEAR
ncbi:MAG: efflux RND transporter periplasmic adaptor subunit [Sphingomonadales bacterium]|nr:efflux RND transporter periplasmic adaptor subunit [Sphingomonadales bacterium]